jgi:hypothetical protein
LGSVIWRHKFSTCARLSGLSWWMFEPLKFIEQLNVILLLVYRQSS